MRKGWKRKKVWKERMEKIKNDMREKMKRYKVRWDIIEDRESEIRYNRRQRKWDEREKMKRKKIIWERMKREKIKRESEMREK